MVRGGGVFVNTLVRLVDAAWPIPATHWTGLFTPENSGAPHGGIIRRLRRDRKVVPAQLNPRRSELEFPWATEPSRDRGFLGRSEIPLPSSASTAGVGRRIPSILKRGRTPGGILRPKTRTLFFMHPPSATAPQGARGGVGEFPRRGAPPSRHTPRLPTMADRCPDPAVGREVPFRRPRRWASGISTTMMILPISEDATHAVFS